MKTYFVYTSMSGEEHRIDVEEFMKENGYTDIGHCKRNLMMWIGINKHFEDIGQLKVLILLVSLNILRIFADVYDA